MAGFGRPPEVRMYNRPMTKDAIRAQIEAMPEGPQKDLASFMNAVYESEDDDGWEAVEQTYDLLEAPLWTPPAPGQHVFGNPNAITKEAHEKLAALRRSAGGSFYLKDGQIMFVTDDEWQQIRSGRRQP
jgi:hypothetical protein